MARERKYQTSIGSFIVNRYGATFRLGPGFSSEKWQMLAEGTIFEKRGKKGLRSDSQILLYPIFDEIGIVPGAGKIYLVAGERYTVLSEAGKNIIDEWYLKDSHFIFKDGKMGWEKNGEVVVPPLYDEVYEWGLGLYHVKEKDKAMYVDSKGQEKLTFRRQLLYQYNEPFWLRANDHDAMTFIECPPMPDIPDCNVWDYNDLKLGIDRANTSDIVEELINTNDEIPLTKEKLKDFINKFAYEFSAYRFTVRTENAIDELFELMEKLNVSSNSWYYLMRFTTTPDEKIPASQLCRLPQKMLGLRNGTIRSDYAIGTDENQTPRTTSVLVITYYREICFPPRIYFELGDIAKEGTLHEVEVKVREVLSYTEQAVRDHYRNDFLDYCYRNAFCMVDYTSNRSWEETENVLECLSQNSDIYKNYLKSAVGKLVSVCRGKSETIKVEFNYNYIVWLINKSARVNEVFNGKTPLDILNSAINDRGCKRKLILKKIRRLLIGKGALTYVELKEKFEQTEGLYEFALYLLGKENTDLWPKSLSL